MEANSKPVSSTSSVANAWARAVASPASTWLLLLAVVAWELGILAVLAGRKPFWYDELLTFHVSNLHPFSALWRALYEGADGTPPGYYAIVGVARMLPGDPHVTLRLPSIAGYLLTLLAVYRFARKRLPVLTGATAVLLVTLSPFRAYALEARSYTLLVGCLAIAAVLWQMVDERRFATPLLALFLALAVSSHHYAVLAIAIFGLAELAWTFLSRRIRWGVWAACLLATAPFFANLAVLAHYRAVFGTNFWAQPQWTRVVSTYAGYLGLGINLSLALTALLGIVIGMAALGKLRQRANEAPKDELGAHELVLLGGFIAYPAVLVTLTKMAHAGYVDRYGWPAVFGLVVGAVYVLRRTSARPLFVLSALLIAFAYQGLQDLSAMRTAGTMSARWSRLEAISRREPDVPVVISSALYYLEADKYAPPELHDRLVMVVDEDATIRILGADTAEKTNRILAQFVPLRLQDLSSFEAAHRRFVWYSVGADDWLTQYLLERQFRLTLMARDRGNAVYVVEK